MLAHLVTCPQCKAAASEQRRLKSVVAASEQPMLSAGLLARLQGLPGLPPTGDGTDGGDRTPDRRDRDDRGHGPGAGGRDQERRGPFDGGLLGSGVFGGGGSRRREEFSYLTPGRDLIPGGSGGSGGRGFRIHELTSAAAADGSPEDRERPEPPAHSGSGTAASRGRRFAFAAAGAFSMAAIALGSALPMEAAVDGGARPDDGPAVSPLSANSVPDTRGVTPRGVLDAGDRRTLRAPGAVTSVTPVSVTRPLMAPGALPLVTPAASPVSPGPQVPAIRR
ncbi:hypothetical protein BGM09_07085 [Streptomyces sp. CBMA29]|nr:hypothetical protein [Streptomyces sp. CBMA29]